MPQTKNFISLSFIGFISSTFLLSVLYIFIVLLLSCTDLAIFLLSLDCLFSILFLLLLLLVDLSHCNFCIGYLLFLYIVLFLILILLVALAGLLVYCLEILIPGLFLSLVLLH